MTILARLRQAAWQDLEFAPLSLSSDKAVLFSTLRLPRHLTRAQRA
jgi:hypothetical protein